MNKIQDKLNEILSPHLNDIYKDIRPEEIIDALKNPTDENKNTRKTISSSGQVDIEVTPNLCGEDLVFDTKIEKDGEFIESTYKVKRQNPDYRNEPKIIVTKTSLGYLTILGM